MHRSQLAPWTLAMVMVVAVGLTFSAGAVAQTSKSESGNSNAAGASGSGTDEVKNLKDQLALQQKEIEKLQQALEQQKQLLLQVLKVNQARPATQASAETKRSDSATNASEKSNLGEVASLNPMLPSAKAIASTEVIPSPAPLSPAAGQDQMRDYVKKVDGMSKTLDALTKGFAGFKLSGDVRLRSDNIFRSANSVAGPAQNVRGRYRVRVNVDKALGDKVDTHVQLASGTFNNPLTFDTDFAGNTTRGAFFLGEAYGAFHPNKQLDLRGGKMTEAFSDNEQFLLDDDIRFNGFQESIKSKSAKLSSGGTINFEFRAGQYILNNPNVQILPTAAQCASAAPPANCAYLTAGFAQGGKAHATDLFDQGFLVSSAGEHWSHQVAFNAQLWRNPNLMQLASTAAGFPLLVNGYYGLTLSGPLTGVGNGTTTSGGPVYTAEHFQIGRVSYRIDYKGLKSKHQNFPLYLIFQGTRNFGADFYQNAFQAGINVGETKKFGDVLFKYAYYYKQGNSMISQVTDDDVGTNTGVNLRTHAIRFDIGLNKFMVWQNRIYIQNELAPSDPARNFFVPLQLGAETQYRYQGQLQFTF